MPQSNNSECKCCDGNGKVEINYVKLVGICPECEGLGMKDWITEAMGKHERREKDYINCVHQNINTLTYILMKEYEKIGITIDIKMRYSELNIKNFLEKG